jgi:hypothetical protein
MRITLDTNVFGPLVSPAEYPNHPAAAELAVLASEIAAGNLGASISQSALGLEALNRNARIDSFFREWATKTTNIVLPQPDAVRTAILQQALSMGVTVLVVPRIALAPFVNVPADSWAPDSRFSMGERLDRSCALGRDFSHVGLSELKQLGAKLVTVHAIDVSRIAQFPSWPSREELQWLKGIVAEFDDPKMFPSTKKFADHVRDIIAEWSDIDMLAAHYGYGLDVLCTLDTARAAGSNAVLHPNNRASLKNKYGIEIMSPAELAAKV